MARPRARRTILTTVTTTTPNVSDKLVAQSLQRAFEIGEGSGIPLGTIGSGNGITAGEGNIKHIIFVVSMIAVDVLAIAGPSEGVGDLPNQRSAIVTVGVTPNTVKLTMKLGTR